ncbi:hypothetical protein VP01_3262g1 [Puccinia sorghi]|uniref:Uncharacterized protein n=1 Tax=Puccinia sorghi TaxID=27349 RepID=A0A0L6UXW4_9BASI|nr:hypothetical protein VP01_3262g1 [Puccinia sorghi]
MNNVRNPAGSVVGRTATTRGDQSLHDPFRQAPFTHFIKSSTFWKTWPSVCFFVLEAGIIALLNRPTKSLSVSTTILTVLGKDLSLTIKFLLTHEKREGSTVIGFAISYRTSSAYSQYNEARKAWGNVIHHSRTLSRLIWLHLPNELTPHTAKDPATENEKLRAMIEKKTMVNLVQAFSVSLKHYLRGEYGIYYEDLYHLTCILPKYNQVGPKAFSGIPQLPGKFGSQDSSFVVEVEKAYSIGSEDGLPRPASLFQVPTVQPADPMNPPTELLPGYNPPRNTVYDHLPFLKIFRTLAKGSMNFSGLRQASDRRYCPEENIPLEILWHMSLYLSALQARKVIELCAYYKHVQCNAGRPFRRACQCREGPYNPHTVWLSRTSEGNKKNHTIIWGYLTFLPFQLIGTFKKITVPATGLIAFAFLGFLQIGEDIENPFGYASNDLDLDHFCKDIILRELDELTYDKLPRLHIPRSTPPTDPMSFVLTSSNMPLFGTGCFQTASEMSNSLMASDLEYLLSEPTRVKQEASWAGTKDSGKTQTVINIKNKT